LQESPFATVNEIDFLFLISQYLHVYFTMHHIYVLVGRLYINGSYMTHLC